MVQDCGLGAEGIRSALDAVQSWERLKFSPMTAVDQFDDFIEERTGKRIAKRFPRFDYATNFGGALVGRRVIPWIHEEIREIKGAEE